MKYLAFLRKKGWKTATIKQANITTLEYSLEYNNIELATKLLPGCEIDVSNNAIVHIIKVKNIETALFAISIVLSWIQNIMNCTTSKSKKWCSYP